MGEKCCEGKKDCSDKKSCESEKCGSGFCCPITGFKICFNKKFAISAIAMVIWVNVFSCIWHGFVMSGMYQETANLWRGQTEMKILALHGGLSISSIAAAYIFMKGYECSGCKEGLRFGIIITALLGGLALVAYATQPIPKNIIGMWILGDLICYSLGGMMLCGLYCRMCCKESCNQKSS